MEATQSMNYSLIIPTYNERDNIIPLVERIHQALSRYKYEVLFVDDDSRDGTADTIRAMAVDYPVRVLVRKNKRGLATAVTDGFLNTSSEIICVMDADLQHPPEILPSLIQKIENGQDIVVASRYVPGGGCEGWALTRKIISKGAILLAHILLPGSRMCHDPMSGFFMLRRSTIEKAQLSPTGYKILLEILLMGNYRTLAEVPFTFVARTHGESKLSAKTQKEYLKHLLSLMRRKGEITRFLKFCLVGASGVFVNMGLLWLLKGLLDIFDLIAVATGIEASVISNFVLNDIITFGDRHSSGIKSFVSRLLRFNLVSLAGVGINLTIYWLLTRVFHMHYLISNLAGIAVATLWNYLVNTLWTWQ
ncbi:MAG: glycosyltransferase family 2 protein [Chloroflexota bacterium]